MKDDRISISAIDPRDPSLTSTPRSLVDEDLSLEEAVKALVDRATVRPWFEPTHRHSLPHNVYLNRTHATDPAEIYRQVPKQDSISLDALVAKLLETVAINRHTGTVDREPPSLQMEAGDGQPAKPVVLYWLSATRPSGDAVLWPQKLLWSEFVDTQRQTRDKFRDRPFGAYLQHIVDRRRTHALPTGLTDEEERHAVAEQLLLLPDAAQQSLAQTWLEYQEHVLQSIEHLQASMDQLRKESAYTTGMVKLLTSGASVATGRGATPQPLAGNLASLQRSVQLMAHRLTLLEMAEKRQKLLLRWSEDTRRARPELQLDWEEEEDNGNDDDDEDAQRQAWLLLALSLSRHNTMRSVRSQLLSRSSSASDVSLADALHTVHQSSSPPGAESPGVATGTSMGAQAIFDAFDRDSPSNLPAGAVHRINMRRRGGSGSAAAACTGPPPSFYVHGRSNRGRRHSRTVSRTSQ